MVSKYEQGKKVIIIFDTQLRKGVSVAHIPAISRYIVKQKPDTLVVIGDWWDCPSLSVFNTELQKDGLRLKEDLNSGWRGMDLLYSPIKKEQQRLKQGKRKQWNLRSIFTVGNHDPQVRIPRFLEAHPVLEGYLQDDTSQRLTELGFEVFEFGEIAVDAGIHYAHYFINPHSAKKSPIGGSIDTMLKNVGYSFVQGHTQTHKTGKHFLSNGEVRLGIVNGCTYLHNETYMGAQGNKAHWRGIVQLNDVKNGGGDILELSLEYLMHKYGKEEDKGLVL